MNLIFLLEIAILTIQAKTESNRTSYQEHVDKVYKFKNEITSSYDLNKLRQSLIYGYDRSSRPVINSSQPLKVKVGVNVAQINGLDEKLQVNFRTYKSQLRLNL